MVVTALLLTKTEAFSYPGSLAGVKSQGSKPSLFTGRCETEAFRLCISLGGVNSVGQSLPGSLNHARV
jgi:hypothetical protein